MLIHLYSSAQHPQQGKGPFKPTDEERRMMNGHARVPNAADRQAPDAQEFELENLMSEDEDEDNDHQNAKEGAGRSRS